MASKKEFKVDIDNFTIENILNTITEEIIENTHDVMEQDILKLKRSAAKFLSTVLETQEKIQHIENMMLAQKKLRNQIRSDLKVTGRFLPQYETDAYRKNKEELNNDLRSKEVEKIYEASFIFHEELNQVLKQKVSTIIVLQDKEGTPYLFEVSKNDIFNNNILSFEETSKTARLSARFKVSIEQMRNAGIKALERDDLNIQDNLNVDNLNITYKTVLYRYDTYDRLVLQLFPSSPKTQKHSKVSARGDIAEAYSMFFLKQAEYNFQSNNKEENIDYFMVLGVQEVDNISGLLQGDVSSGEYEYAIKSADASYMSIVQMIPLAKEIIEKDSYSLIDLENYKKKLASKKSKIRNPIHTVLEEQVSGTLSDIISNLDLNRT